MITTHIKQAWQLMKQNKLFSGIYILGTALAIAATTIFAIAYYIRIAPVYPEYQRDRMSHIYQVYVNYPGLFTNGGWLSADAVKNYISQLPSAECVSASMLRSGTSLEFDDDRTPVKVAVRYADPNFFKIYSYEFLDGAPFTTAEFESGAARTAISDRMAEKIFGTTRDVIGRTVSLDFKDYTICGVFREGSALNPSSFGQFIAPYYALPEMQANNGGSLIGRLRTVILSDDVESLRNELAEVGRKYAAEHEGLTVDFRNQPYTDVEMALANPSRNNDIDWVAMWRRNILILLVLLIVPALNLSGMIAGRMDSRRAEIGVRKSFGGGRRALLSQVLWENLVLTITGGIVGLVVAWLLIHGAAGWLLKCICGSNEGVIVSTDMYRATPDMLFAPTVFICAFVFCVLLNIVSALIPAWSALRRPIVNSLKQ